ARSDRCVQDIFTIASMPVGYRYGIASPAVLRGGRRGAALRTGRGAPAPRAARPLPPDPGLGERDRVPTVRPPSAGCPPERGGTNVPRRGPADPSARQRSDDPCGAGGPRTGGNAAGGLHRERVV